MGFNHQSGVGRTDVTLRRKHMNVSRFRSPNDSRCGVAAARRPNLDLFAFAIATTFVCEIPQLITAGGHIVLFAFPGTSTSRSWCPYLGFCRTFARREGEIRRSCLENIMVFTLSPPWRREDRSSLFFYLYFQQYQVPRFAPSVAVSYVCIAVSFV